MTEAKTEIMPRTAMSGPEMVELCKRHTMYEW